MTLTEFIRDRVTKLLDTNSVLVWYDDGGRMSPAINGFAPTNTTVVSGAPSVLEARRLADACYSGLYPIEEGGTPGPRLLIYLPHKRPATNDERMRDPMELYSLVGATFGDSLAETLQALARAAMPDVGPEIDRLFEQGVPTIERLEGLSRGAERAALRLALGTTSAPDVVAQLLCEPDAPAKVDSALGARNELRELLQEDLEFSDDGSGTTASIVGALGRYVLLSEFLHDIPPDVEAPAALATVPHAPRDLSERIFATCDRMRRDQEWRAAYMDMAMAVERDLGIAAEAANLPTLGERDTFSCEERHHLQRATIAATEGRLDDSREAIAKRRRSVWREFEERVLLWKLLERCVAFLDVAAAVETQLKPEPTSVREAVERYVADEGGWQLDHCQRLFEQAEAHAAQFDEIETLVSHCRNRYRTVAEAMQRRFLSLVEKEGWPPAGFSPHVKTFASAVKPQLDARRRVAYFFVDAMRYEMGRGLTEELKALGEVTLRPVTNVLPAVTPCGMAALLPGADTTYRLEVVGGDVVPSVGGISLPTSKARMDYMRSQLGDLFGEADIGSVMSWSSKRLDSATRGKSIFVVRTQDIDGIGENMSAYSARSMMSSVLGDLQTATRRLAALGFQAFVFVGDHGHILLPEAEAGQVVSKPPGQWLKEKRRSLVGTAQGVSPGTHRLPTAKMGMLIPAPDLVVATGFCAFSAGETYFHEGLSLQECVVPLVVLETRQGGAPPSPARVTLGYRSTKFTSQVLSVKAVADGTLFGPIEVRIQAFDGSGANAHRVGDAADCDARNPETGLIVLASGEEVHVAIRIDDGFRGEAIELRATDPVTGRTMGSLTLQNATEEW